MESDPNEENGDADENDAADPAEITAEQVFLFSTNFALFRLFL